MSFAQSIYGNARRLVANSEKAPQYAQAAIAGAAVFGGYGGAKGAVSSDSTVVGGGGGGQRVLGGACGGFGCCPSPARAVVGGSGGGGQRVRPFLGQCHQPANDREWGGGTTRCALRGGV